MPNERILIKIDGREIKEVYPDLISLEVEVDREAAAVFNLNLPLELDKRGKWSFVDESRWRPWAKVQIEAGFGNSFKEIFRGFITHIVPHFKAEVADSFLAIRGLDATAAMNTQEKLKSWPNQKDSDIAGQIFSNYSLIPVVTATSVVYTQTISTIVQRETDIRFLKRLAQRNGYECFVEAGKGFFRPPDLRSPPQKVLAAHFGDDTNLAGFQAEVNATRPATVEMNQFDPLTREERNAKAQTVDWRQLGKTPALSVYSSPVKTGLQFARNGVAAFPQQMQAMTQAMTNENGWLVEAEGEILSELYGAVLRPRRLVTIKGVGERFSGVYYVTNVRHNFSPFGYTQRFRAVRNALGVTGTENFRGLSF